MEEEKTKYFVLKQKAVPEALFSAAISASSMGMLSAALSVNSRSPTVIRRGTASRLTRPG